MGFCRKTPMSVRNQIEFSDRSLRRLSSFSARSLSENTVVGPRASNFFAWQGRRSRRCWFYRRCSRMSPGRKRAAQGQIEFSDRLLGGRGISLEHLVCQCQDSPHREDAPPAGRRDDSAFPRVRRASVARPTPKSLFSVLLKRVYHLADQGSGCVPTGPCAKNDSGKTRDRYRDRVRNRKAQC